MGTARNALIGKKELIDRISRRWGLREIRVFGSVARGEDGPESDIDLVCYCDWGKGTISRPTLARLASLGPPIFDGDAFSFLWGEAKRELKAGLGVKADLGLIFLDSRWGSVNLSDLTPEFWERGISVEDFYGDC